MKKINCILVALLLMSTASFASIISTTHSNIKHGVAATYTTEGRLTLTFDKTQMTKEDLKALAGGSFATATALVLTDAECKAIGAPRGTTIPAGKYDIVTKGTGLPSATISTSRSNIKQG